MSTPHGRSLEWAAPLDRLSRLAKMPETDERRLKEATRRSRTVAARRDILLEGEPLISPAIILSGWACRTRLLADGRRQILGFYLPGDIIGMCRQPEPVAISVVSAITDVILCDAPPPRTTAESDELGRAYAICAALDEAYLLNQIARLGRQTAYERLAHLMLEFWERLKNAGLIAGNRFPMPLTQEYLGDTLGLTSVHINRTLQQLRREHMLEAVGGHVTLIKPGALTVIADYKPARVSGQEQGGAPLALVRT